MTTSYETIFVDAAASSHSPTSSVTHPVKPWLYALLIAAWLIPGLIGHDPWKPDEAFTFGVIYHLLQSGDWVIPTLAGEVFLEEPPLYYMTAALFADVFSAWLPLHDGARLASGFYVALTLLFVGLTARTLYGRDHGWIAAIALIGCVGLLVRAHQTITDTSFIFGFALVLYGLSISASHKSFGGILLGTGMGVSFMSYGLIGPLIVILIALILPSLFSVWRTRNYVWTLALALLASLPWLMIWPYALYQHSPELFSEWLWRYNVERFTELFTAGPSAENGGYLRILPWYAWPVLPLALWAIWRGGRTGLSRPPIHLPLVTFLVMLGVLSAASDARELYAMPMLLPLALLATASVETLRRGAASALDWFGIMTFGVISGLLWIGWIALLTGHPLALAERLQNYNPLYVPTFDAWRFILGVLLTVFWLALVSRIGRSNRRAIVNWAGGITLMWALAITLWLPFVDQTKSYRSMIVALHAKLPERYRCVASIGLGQSQRALLDYFAGIKTQRIEVRAPEDCDVLLTQGTEKNLSSPGGRWRQIWEGSRPGDASERYRLYQWIGRGKPSF